MAHVVPGLPPILPHACFQIMQAGPSVLHEAGLQLARPQGLHDRAPLEQVSVTFSSKGSSMLCYWEGQHSRWVKQALLDLLSKVAIEKTHAAAARMQAGVCIS